MARKLACNDGLRIVHRTILTQAQRHHHVASDVFSVQSSPKLAMKQTDLHALPENERIKVIGKLALKGERVGVFLEMDALAPGKIDRYIRKVRMVFPRVGVVGRGPTSALHVECITFGLLQ